MLTSHKTKIALAVSMIAAGGFALNAQAGYLQTFTDPVAKVENQTFEMTFPVTTKPDGIVDLVPLQDSPSVTQQFRNNTINVNAGGRFGGRIFGVQQIIDADQTDVAFTGNNMTVTATTNDVMLGNSIRGIRADYKGASSTSTLNGDISDNSLTLALREDTIVSSKIATVDIKYTQYPRGNPSVDLSINRNRLAVRDGHLKSLASCVTLNSPSVPSDKNYGTIEISDNQMTVQNASVEYPSNQMDPTLSVVRMNAYKGNIVNAKKNTLILDNVRVAGQALKGFRVAGAWFETGNGTLNANNNTVHIKNGLSFGDSSDYKSEIWGAGGYLVYSPTINSSGNTLIVGAKNVSVGMIAAFDNLTFSLPADIGSGDTMLSLNGRTIDNLINDHKTLDLNDLTIKVELDPALQLADGSTVTLLENADATDNITLTPLAEALVIPIGGDALMQTEGQIAMSADGKKLNLTTHGSGLSPNSKSLAEAQLAGVAFVNQAADLASRQTGAIALRGESGFGFFADAEYADTEYETGSHVDVDGYSLVMGGAWKGNLLQKDVVLGGFIEMGNGNYDAFNSFATGDVKASGDTDYVGVGLMARMALTDAVYLDASLRMGRVETDYSAGALDLDYETKSDYMGFHVGAGYEKTLASNVNWLTYGQFLYTFQEGDSVTVKSHRVAFDDVNSLRTRLGTRLEAGFGFAKAYAGAAWEYEFSGNADATIDGMSVEAPELKGSTGMFEVGFTAPEAAGLPMTIGVGLRGYVGQREGVAGNATLTWRF